MPPAGHDCYGVFVAQTLRQQPRMECRRDCNRFELLLVYGWLDFRVEIREAILPVSQPRGFADDVNANAGRAAAFSIAQLVVSKNQIAVAAQDRDGRRGRVARLRGAIVEDAVLFEN